MAAPNFNPSTSPGTGATRRTTLQDFEAEIQRCLDVVTEQWEKGDQAERDYTNAKDEDVRARFRAADEAIRGELAAAIAAVRRDTLDPVEVRSLHRPGDVPAAFGVANGEDGVPSTNADGAALRYSGSAEVVSRAFTPLERDRRYEARFAVRRHQDTPDPANDAVEFRLRYFDKNKALISPVRVLQTVTGLTVAGGTIAGAFIVARNALSAGVIEAPPGARYAKAAIRIYGDDHQTDIEVCSIAELPWSEQGEQGETGAQGQTGQTGRRGPSGAPGSFLGFALDGSGATLPVSAGTGDTFGLIAGNDVTTYVWLDGAWRQALAAAPMHHPSYSPAAPSVWTLSVTGNGTAGPYELYWDGPAMFFITGDFVATADYTRTGTTVTFDSPVANGVAISVVMFETGAGFQAQPVAITGNGTAGPYTVPANATIAVLFAGGGMIPFDDFTIAGASLTFDSPLAAGVKAEGMAMVGVVRQQAPALYDSRAEAEAAVVPIGVDTILVRHLGVTLAYRRQPGGTALTTQTGVKWSPAGDKPSPLHYGALCDGSSDDAPFWYACGLENGRAFGLGKTYTFESACAWPRGLAIRELDLGNGRIRLSAAMGFVPAFAVRGAGLDAATGGAGVVATCVTSVAENAASITVVSAAGLASGDVIELRSAEYWHGVTGVAGFGVQTKSELAEVRSIAGNVVTLMAPTRNTYDGATFTVSIRKLAMLPSCVIRDGEIEGLAQHIGGQGDLHVQTFPKVSRAEFVRGLRIENLRHAGFVSTIHEAFYCVDVAVDRNEFTGPDLAAENLPWPTTYWAKGLVAESCERVVFSGNFSERLREPVDVVGGIGPATRDVTIVGNAATDCLRAFTSHMAENLTATGNTSRTREGFIFRGRHATITGNVFDLYSVTPAARFGDAPPTTAYSEGALSGHVVFNDNLLFCAGGEGLVVRCGLVSLSVKGNTFVDVRNGVEIWGKSCRALAILDNTFVSATAAGDGAPTTFGVVVANHPNVPLTRLDFVDILGNTFSGHWGDGIMVLGTASGGGAGPVRIQNNVFDDVRLRGISFQEVSADSVYGDTGLFGAGVFIKDVVFHDAPPTMTVHPAGGAQAAISGPRRLGAPAYVVRTGFGAGDALLPNTYLEGWRELYVNIVAGGYEGRVCMAQGTGGTLAGVTGAISNGSPTLTVNNAGGIGVGAFLVVAGSGLPANASVIAKNGNVLTMSANATTTVSGAAVTYRAPTFKGFGRIEA